MNECKVDAPTMTYPARWRNGSGVGFAVERSQFDFFAESHQTSKVKIRASCLGLSRKGIVWKQSRLALLLCPWKRYLGHSIFMRQTGRGPNSPPVAAA